MSIFRREKPGMRMCILGSLRMVPQKLQKKGHSLAILKNSFYLCTQNVREVTEI